MNSVTVCNMIVLCWFLLMCYHDSTTEARRVIIHIPEESRTREVVHRPKKYHHKHHHSLRSHKKHVEKEEPLFDGVYIDDSPGDDGMRDSRFGRNHNSMEGHFRKHHSNHHHGGSFNGNLNGGDFSSFHGGDGLITPEQLIKSAFVAGSTFGNAQNLIGHPFGASDSASGSSQNLIQTILSGMGHLPAHSQNSISSSSLIKPKGIDFSSLENLSNLGARQNPIPVNTGLAGYSIVNGQLLPQSIANIKPVSETNIPLTNNVYSTNPIQFPPSQVQTNPIQASIALTQANPQLQNVQVSQSATSFKLSETIAPPQTGQLYQETYSGPTGYELPQQGVVANIGDTIANVQKFSALDAVNPPTVQQRSMNVDEILDQKYGYKGGMHEKGHFIKVSDSPEDPMNGTWPF